MSSSGHCTVILKQLILRISDVLAVSCNVEKAGNEQFFNFMPQYRPTVADLKKGRPPVPKFGSVHLLHYFLCNAYTLQIHVPASVYDSNDKIG